ncbi:MAG: hypothetical protein ACOZCK_04915 [Pseudomonadota bacterium]
MHIFRSESWPTIMVIGAFVLGILFANLPNNGDWQPGWEMVSGLGTFSAAAIALWIARNDSNRRHEEAAASMYLTAARLYLPFVEASRRLGYIGTIVRDNGDTISNQEQYRILLGELQRVNLTITNEDLLALVPLPNRAAYLLAGAVGNVSIAIGLFESSEFIFCSGMHLIRRPAILSKIEFCVTEASQQLEKVAVECKKASITLINPHH